MKTILVTGGFGFIGSNFISLLLTEKKDYQVINVDKLTYAANIENLKELSNIWLDVNKDVYVNNLYGNKNRISKLYWNGFCNTKKLIFNDNYKTEQSLTHKYLVKINDKEAIWKPVNELKIGDKILKIK